MGEGCLYLAEEEEEEGDEKKGKEETHKVNLLSIWLLSFFIGLLFWIPLVSPHLFPALPDFFFFFVKKKRNIL